MAATGERSYAHRSLAAKLGISEGQLVVAIDPPAGFSSALGGLPNGAELREKLTKNATVIIWFLRNMEDYLSRLSTIAPYGEGRKIWMAWPKKASGIKTDLSENAIRDAALQYGLVDYKVCSIDDTWSGLLFTKRKSR